MGDYPVAYHPNFHDFIWGKIQKLCFEMKTKFGWTVLPQDFLKTMIDLIPRSPPCCISMPEDYTEVMLESVDYPDFHSHFGDAKNKELHNKSVWFFYLIGRECNLLRRNGLQVKLTWYDFRNILQIYMDECNMIVSKLTESRKKNEELNDIFSIGWKEDYVPKDSWEIHLRIIMKHMRNIVWNFRNAFVLERTELKPNHYWSKKIRKEVFNVMFEEKKLDDEEELQIAISVANRYISDQ